MINELRYGIVFLASNQLVHADPPVRDFDLCTHYSRGVNSGGAGRRFTSTLSRHRCPTKPQGLSPVGTAVLVARLKAVPLTRPRIFSGPEMRVLKQDEVRSRGLKPMLDCLPRLSGLKPGPISEANADATTSANAGILPTPISKLRNPVRRAQNGKLSWVCIGTAGKPADADSDPGYDRARLQRAEDRRLS